MEYLDLRVPRQPVLLNALREAQRTRGPAPGEMVVDEQTLRDLEVFEAERDAPSLYALLNRTRTAGGDRVLRGRFRKPLSTSARIRAVQQSLEHIARHRAPFSTLPGEVMVAAVQEYLQSNFSLVGSSRPFLAALDGLELRLTDYKEYRRLAMGLRRTARVLRALERVAQHPELVDAGGELGERLEELRALLAGPGLAELPDDGEGELPWWRILRVDRRLRGDERATLERLVAVVYELDALVSMADANSDYGFVLPEVGDGPAEVMAAGVYHPFLAAPVANPLRVDQRKRLLFITGPNMAGKTTYLRACATAVYLAHLGMGVPAQAFRFTPFDGLFTAITLADNVREGVSFFRAEALRVRRIAQALADGLHVFALLDEPFKGTNVKDALDASRAVFIWFAREPGSVFLVSSHLIEVGEDLEATGCVASCRFEAAEGADGLEYDFVLRPGISSQRLGMRVLEEEGVFELRERSALRRNQAP